MAKDPPSILEMLGIDLETNTIKPNNPPRAEGSRKKPGRPISNALLTSAYARSGEDNRIPYTYKHSSLLYHGGPTRFKTLHSKNIYGVTYASSNADVAEQFAVGRHGGGFGNIDPQGSLRTLSSHVRRLGYVHVVDPKNYTYSHKDASLFTEEFGYNAKGKQKPIGGYWVHERDGKISRTHTPLIKPGQEIPAALGVLAVGAGVEAYRHREDIKKEYKTLKSLHGRKREREIENIPSHIVGHYERAFQNRQRALSKSFHNTHLGHSASDFYYRHQHGKQVKVHKPKR